MVTLVIGLVSSPGILSTGLKYRPLGLSQTEIIRTSLPLTEGYAWHFGL